MENDFIEIIEGSFTKIIFQSSNYMVAKFDTNEGPITVTGPCFEADMKQKYLLTGVYIDHPKYGFQFSIKTIERLLPSKKEEIISFLSSKTFKGIGKKAAEKIYNQFGDNTLSLLKDNLQLINDIDLTQKQLLGLTEGFASLNNPENEIMFFLASNGFNNIDSQKIFSKFKLATIEVANDNPFRFYNEVYGIGFNKVREFASKFEFNNSQIKFQEAFIINLISEYAFNSGDTYILEDNLKDQLLKYGNFNNYNEIIDLAIEHNYIVKESNRLYLFNDYHDESYIAEFLNTFKNDFVVDETLINEGIDLYQKQLNIEYDAKQKDAIINFFSNDFSIIVGGPGTGKTTIVKTMVNLFRDYMPYNSLIVVAPTGRAAKRVNEVCNVEAKTIHSLLKWNKETNTFNFDIDNPLMYDAIIVDEFSMVDNNLFACLLKACRNVKKICIIGDDNQLPSIRPGYVLNDLIEANRFVVTHLNNNYRQSNGNEIIDLCKDIISNDVDMQRFNKDINFIDIKKQAFNLVNMIKNDINNGYNLDDIQVLTPMYKGEFGIENLNIQLQMAFNPADIHNVEKNSGIYTFRKKDKILQLKNRPSDDVYNGDIGILEDIDLKQKNLLVNYNNVFCYYSFDELNEISLAYAMSVHKSQGSEYPIVYFILTRNNMHMLNKKLIYTAVSRAKMKLTIIGEESVLLQGINHQMKKRNTTLIYRLDNCK